MNYLEPLEITAGDTVKWTRQLADYLASDGWVLKYALRGPTANNITATAADDDHLVTIASAIAPALLQGTYQIQGYVEKGSERHTVYRGELIVHADLVSAGSGYDGRTHVQKVLAAIEATIEGVATASQSEMWIDGDKIVNKTNEELIALRRQYRRERQAEIRRQRRKQGRTTSRLIKYQL